MFHVLIIKTKYAMLVVIEGEISASINKIGFLETSPLYWVVLTHICMCFILTPFVILNVIYIYYNFIVNQLSNRKTFNNLIKT